MSRSYKRTPYCGDHPIGGVKRAANKRIRRILKNRNIDIHGKDYRKYFETWIIRDYREIAPSFETFYKEQIERWLHPYWYRHRGDRPPTREECRRLYDRWYRRK